MTFNRTVHYINSILSLTNQHRQVEYQLPLTWLWGPCRVNLSLYSWDLILYNEIYGRYTRLFFLTSIVAYYKTKTWDSFVTFLLRSSGARAEMCGLQYYKVNLFKCTDLCSGTVKRSLDKPSSSNYCCSWENRRYLLYHCCFMKRTGNKIDIIYLCLNFSVPK